MKTRNIDFIKNDENITIGFNIRRLRIAKGIGQTQLVALMQLRGVNITRQTLVKIETGTQHIKATQFKAIKEILETTYDELLKERE